MNIVKELRTRALHCTKDGYRDAMKAAADRVQEAIGFLAHDYTDEAMIRLNGAWAHAVRVLEAQPDETDPQPPSSGDSEPARLAA